MTTKATCYAAMGVEEEMKTIIIMAVLLMAATAGANDLEDAFKKYGKKYVMDLMVEEHRKELPIALDEDTTLTNLVFIGNALRYQVEVNEDLKKIYDSLTSDGKKQLREEIQTFLRNAHCSTTGSLKFLGAGITLKTTYYDPDGHTLWTFITELEDCLYGEKI